VIRSKRSAQVTRVTNVAKCRHDDTGLGSLRTHRCRAAARQPSTGPTRVDVTGRIGRQVTSGAAWLRSRLVRAGVSERRRW
jgi:hypothetical protein